MKLRALILCMLLAVSVGVGHARETAVIVTFEGVSLSELLRWNIPEFRRLISAGAFGLMNNKTAASQNFEDNAVTIGAGSRGMGYERPTLDAFSKYAGNISDTLDGESLRSIYIRNTGLDPDGASVVQVKIGAVITTNANLGYTVIPGLLGGTLKKAGVEIAVVGNSDRGNIPFRSAVMIAMDQRGLVEHGDVGRRVLLPDVLAPFGVRTNFSRVWEVMSSARGEKRFIVIELGDGGRAEAAGPDLMPGRLDFFKRRAALECARFLVDLLNRLKGENHRYLLVFIVPAQGIEAYTVGDRLTPVIVLGTGIKPGLATSSTTKRPGIITNLDIAPTVLQFFNVNRHPSMLGMPIYSCPCADSASTLARMNRGIVQTFNARRPIVAGVVSFTIAATLLAVLSILVRTSHLPVLGKLTHFLALRFMITASMLSPVVLLVAPLFGIRGILETALFMVVVCFFLGFVLTLAVRDLRILFGIVGLGVAGAFIADLLTGSNLTKNSIFGYDPIAGLRFYGIGNESTGVLLGSLTLGVLSLLSRCRGFSRLGMACIGLFFASVVCLVGSPLFGSDFGGVPALIVAFGYAIYKLQPERPPFKVIASLVVVAAIVLSSVILANILVDPAHQTHIGRAIAQSKELGAGIFWDLAVRKWEMNLRMFKYSIWTYVLVCMVIGLVILFVRPVGLLKETLNKEPAMNAAFTGTLAGSIVGFLINDSGLVLAATALLYMALPLILMVKMETLATSMK